MKTPESLLSEGLNSHTQKPQEMNETKRCTKCKAERQLKDFHKHTRLGLHPSCKDCRNKTNKKAKEAPDSNFYVYELDTGHIGQTKNVEWRMRNHIDAKKIERIDQHTILAVCSCREEALDFEALYQSLSPNYDKADRPSRLKKL